MNNENLFISYVCNGSCSSRFNSRYNTLWFMIITTEIIHITINHSDLIILIIAHRPFRMIHSRRNNVNDDVTTTINRFITCDANRLESRAKSKSIQIKGAVFSRASDAKLIYFTCPSTINNNDNIFIIRWAMRTFCVCLYVWRLVLVGIIVEPGVIHRAIRPSMCNLAG